MELMWAIYWIDVLGNISGGLNGFGAVGTIVTVLCLIVGGMLVSTSYSEKDPDMKKGCTLLRRAWQFGIITAILFTLSIFVPSKKTMYAMMAANVGQKIVESPQMQEIGGKALKILNDKLDELAGERKKE